MRYELTSIIDVHPLEVADDDTRAPTGPEVLNEYHAAIEHWREDVGDVHFTIISTNVREVG